MARKAGLRGQLLNLIDRKLSGERRQEAIAWTRLHAGDWQLLQNMIARLNTLPDRPGQHPMNMLSAERREQLRQEYATTKARAEELAERYGVSRKYVYDHCAGLRRPRKSE